MVNDPSMRVVVVTEAYLKIDIEGDGVPTLHKFLCGGTNYEILEQEPWDKAPFADFHVDPEPHAFYGRSLAELVLNDQDTTTSVLRGILDNVALVNTPRLEVNEDLVVMEDVLNNEIGAVIRSEQIGSVNPLVVPFVAGSTLPALQYLDMLVEEKTGISKMSMGLNADALQNTTATGAALTAQASAGHVEVMARNLAEGMKRLFQLMLHVSVKNAPNEQMMRLNGEFIPVDPSVWDASMDMDINVGLGTGQEDVKAAALMQTFSTQQQIWQTYGPQNGLVSMTQMRNTLSDMLALSGLKNADRYYAPMTPEKEQQIMAQMAEQAAQAAQGQQGDQVAEAMITSEQIKAQAKGGRIILNGTESALHGGSAMSFPYAVAKRGTECLVEGLAREGAPDGILVNGIRLGCIRSGFHERWHKKTDADMAERISLIPLKRAGEPEEAAALIAFLLSGWAGFITGQMIPLTGGDWL